MSRESLVFDVPTHSDRADRPVCGRTPKELVILSVGLLSGLGALQQSQGGVARCVELAVLGLAVAQVWWRPYGRSPLGLGRTIWIHVAGPRRYVWRARAAGADADGRAPGRPPHLDQNGWRVHSAPEPPAPTPGQPTRFPMLQAQPFIPVHIADGIVTCNDGHRCAVLECSGENTALMDAEALRGVHAAYHAFLVGLSFPVQLLVYAHPADLRTYSAARARRLGTLPPALRRLESADSAYMEREARRRGVLDHRTFLVVPAPHNAGRVRAPAGPLAPLRRRALLREVADDDVPRLLNERCERIMTNLAAARVHVWRLSDAGLAEVWYRLLCPRSALLQPWDPGHAAAAVWPSITFPDGGEGGTHA